MATGVAKSDYLETALLNAVLRNTAFSSPATVYVALYTVSPGEAGGGTEATGDAYARTAVTFAAPSGGQCANSADVQFPTATGDGWGTIVAVGIVDAAAAGNVLYYGALGSSRVIGGGDSLKFTAGNLVVAED